jgi:hypothetical protein
MCWLQIGKLAIHHSGALLLESRDGQFLDENLCSTSAASTACHYNLPQQSGGASTADTAATMVNTEAAAQHGDAGADADVAMEHADMEHDGGGGWDDGAADDDGGMDFTGIVGCCSVDSPHKRLWAAAGCVLGVMVLLSVTSH